MKKSITIILIGCIVLSMVGCEKEDKTTDAYKFKEEYESLNGEKSSSGKIMRTISIPKDNPMKYATAEEIVEKIENKETFVVYFGFAKCPWCRSMIEQLIQSAKDNNVKEIYYVDVLEIRDTYQLEEDGTISKTKDGTESYTTLLEKIGDVLSDYTLTDENEQKILVGEKRIYAPNVVVIVKGTAEKMVEGTSEKLKDPYEELTEEMKKESYNSFKCLWECIEEGANICRKNAC